MNVHGNVMRGGDHGSGQGWGRWEVAPAITPWLWDRARESFYVSGVRPYQLTHRFVTTPPGQRADFAHRVPWFDEDLAPATPRASHRLYRLFEYLETPDRSRGTGPRGRAPGTININSVHDLDAFRALVGPQLEDRRNAIQAVFSRPHDPGFEVSMPGNPGPQPDFDPRAARFHHVIPRAVKLE